MTRRHFLEAAFRKVEIGRSFARQSMRVEAEEAGELHHKDKMKVRMNGIHGIQPEHGMMQEIKKQWISLFFTDGFIGNFIQKEHDGTLYHVVRNSCKRRIVIQLGRILKSAMILVVDF